MYRYVKRLLDVVLSGLAIVLSLPLWVMTIIGIELSDPGPVFYRAERIGRDNKAFVMYKFRSMRVLREAREGAEVSLRPETDRIFPWGRIIRRLKLDELPQLLNILLGDMSIVGPRPVAKDQFALFRFGKYDEARKVRPGLTGPAALYDYIYGDRFEEADEAEYMEKVYPTRRELEYVYVRNQGFLFDAWMCMETVLCVLCSLSGREHTRLLGQLAEMARESVAQRAA